MANFREENGRQIPIRKTRAPKSVLIKKKGKLPENALPGIVIAAIGKIFLVKTKASFECDIVECTAAGMIISQNENATVIAVGDNVLFKPEEFISADSGLPAGTIVMVGQRSTMLSRRAAGKVPYEHVIASNTNNLLIMMAVADPAYNKRLIDRYLVTAELNGLEAAICINKTDIFFNEDVKDDLSAYQSISVPVFFTSAKKNTGINGMIEFLKNKTTVISGPSGAGKSTLINLILGKEVQQVREISERTAKGRHTTSYVRMFEMDENTRIIDTPGIREFGLWGLYAEELALYFHEFDAYFPDCKFPNCTHTHEPGCAVKEAVEEGGIDFERYESYVYLFETLV